MSVPPVVVCVNAERNSSRTDAFTVSVRLPVIEPALVAYRRRRPDAPSLFFRRERLELEAIIAPILARRQRQRDNDILSLLLEYGMSERDVANEIVTMVLAGHETTATALTWAWYLIARHPEVEERPRQGVGNNPGGLHGIRVIRQDQTNALSEAGQP
jgi:cytochrome P450